MSTRLGGPISRQGTSDMCRRDMCPADIEYSQRGHGAMLSSSPVSARHGPAPACQWGLTGRFGAGRMCEAWRIPVKFPYSPPYVGWRRARRSLRWRVPVRARRPGPVRPGPAAGVAPADRAAACLHRRPAAAGPAVGRRWPSAAVRDRKLLHRLGAGRRRPVEDHQPDRHPAAVRRALRQVRRRGAGCDQAGSRRGRPVRPQRRQRQRRSAGRAAAGQDFVQIGGGSRRTATDHW